MSIGRPQMEQQIKKYQTAGEVVSEEDPFSGGIDLSQIDPTQLMNLINAAQARAGAPVTAPSYEQSFDKYVQRLQPYTYQAPRMNIYDVASELGAAILATPATGNAFAGIGQGFAGVSNRIRQNQEANQKLNQQVAMQAASMAMQDEKSANDYLQKYSIEMLKLANDPGDLITIEFDEMIPKLDENKQPVLDDSGVQVMVPSGERMQGSFRNNASSRETIDNLLREQNGVEITSPQSIINMGSPGDTAFISSMISSGDEIAAEARASSAIRDQVAYARNLARQVGPEGFGNVQSFIIPIKNFMSGLGLGGLIDESKLGTQTALNQLGIGFAMAIVGQTKGAISNREMDMFLAASPVLGSTYDGFMKQLTYLDRIAERSQQFSIDYNEEANRLEDSGLTYSKQMRALNRFEAEWSNNNPLFTTEEFEDLRANSNNESLLGEDFDWRVQRNQHTQIQNAQTQGQTGQQSIDNRVDSTVNEIMSNKTMTLPEKKELLQSMVDNGIRVGEEVILNFGLTPKQD